MIYTFIVHYDDGESRETIEAENRPAAEAKLWRRHAGARHQPLAYQYESVSLSDHLTWANT